MKTPLLVSSIAWLASIAGASEAGLPDFNAKMLELPPLSLRDITKGKPAPERFSYPLVEPRPTLSRVAPAPQRQVTRDHGMPILEPDPKVDYKMVVKAPDPAVDFKMIVVRPGPEPSK